MAPKSTQGMWGPWVAPSELRARRARGGKRLKKTRKTRKAEGAESTGGARPALTSAQAVGDADERAGLLRANIAAVMMRVREARRDFLTFYELCWHTPQGKSIEVAPVHRTWIEAIDDPVSPNVLLLAPRGHGKCLTAASCITAASGARVPVAEWRGGDVLAFNMEAGKFAVRRATPAVANGVRRCLRIVTRSGRTDTVTGNHRFALWDRWVHADELRVGDRIAVARHIPVVGQATMSADEAWLLGVITGDGSTTSGHCGITVGDPRVAAQVAGIAEALGWRFTTQKTPASVVGLEFAAGGDLQHGPRAYLRRHGLYKKHAREKGVPPEVFTQPQEQVAAYLAGLLDTDAHVNPHGGGCVEFTSTSEQLLRGGQHLLARLGIVGVLNRHDVRYRGAPYTSWRVLVRSENIVRLAAVVRPRGRRGGQLASLAAQRAEHHARDAITAFPPEIKRLLPSEDWLRNHGLPRPTRGALTRAKVATLTVALASRELQRLVEADVFWDEVIAVEDAGEQETYAIEVEDLHSFLADGIVHHNSELLSARVVWELGRNPRLRVKICTQSDRRARVILHGIKRHIVRNPLVHAVFPGLERDPAGVWTNTQLSVKHEGASRDPSVDALGILSTVVGGHCDLLWADDPMDYRMALLQPKTREAAYHKWTAEWLQVIEPTGRTWITMTPWSRNDLAALTEKTPGWKTVRTPVGDDHDPFKPIWESRWPREALMKKREQWGPIDYDRAMRLRVYAEDVCPVRPAWIKFYDAKQLGDPDRMFCVVAFDLAISQAASADYFAYAVILYDAERNLSFVVEARHDRLSFLEQAGAVIEIARRWGADRIVIEQANYEGALAEYVEELARSPVPIVTVKPRLKKARRLIEITPLIERGRVWFHPSLDPKRAANVASLSRDGDLISELINFPNDDHDDLVDSLTYALASIRDYGAEIGPGVEGQGSVGATVLAM